MGIILPAPIDALKALSRKTENKTFSNSTSVPPKQPSYTLCMFLLNKQKSAEDYTFVKSYMKNVSAIAFPNIQEEFA